MTSRRTWTRFAVLVVLLGFAAPAFAQIDTGVIVGRVVDDSGAVLPGVAVVATQDGTGSTARSGSVRQIDVQIDVQFVRLIS